jgi:hypothetical protein
MNALASTRHSGVDAIFAFALGQLRPERGVFRAPNRLRITKHAVVLTDHLIRAIAHRLQKKIVSPKDMALEVKLDHASRSAQDLPRSVNTFLISHHLHPWWHRYRTHLCKGSEEAAS